MAESPETPVSDEPPSAVVDERAGLSLVWLIPVVAALIGAWVAYSAFSERGPAIEIDFETAEGIVAGKTMVRFKNVDVGQVEGVELSDNLSRVNVTVRMVAGAERYLTSATRFWVARARVSATQVSDVDTLLSGAYIGIDPSTEGSPARRFEGLDTPPVVTSEEEGLHLVLRAETLGSLDVGAPVYYRSIEVGSLVAYELDSDGEGVTVQAFIGAEHEALVHSETHFWNVSGINVSLGPAGLQLDTASLMSMLIGGIAFDTLLGVQRGSAAEDGAVFALHQTRQAAEEARFRIKRRYLMHFEQSVAGLVPGAQVTFRGIAIGEVEGLQLVFDSELREVQIPVVIAVEPERIRIAGDSSDIADRIEWLVGRGMRAQLTTSNLVTGQLSIGLDIHPDAEPAEVLQGGVHPEIPTIPSPLEEITDSVERIVARLEEVPIEEIAQELKDTLAALNTDVAPALAGSLAEAQEALAAVNSMLASDSATGQELRRLVVDLGQAVRGLRRLVEHLEAQPEDLLRGREE